MAKKSKREKEREAANLHAENEIVKSFFGHLQSRGETLNPNEMLIIWQVEKERDEERKKVSLKRIGTAQLEVNYETKPKKDKRMRPAIKTTINKFFMKLETRILRVT